MKIYYTVSEIEHTLSLYPFAKLKRKEIQSSKAEDNENTLIYYSYIVEITEHWLQYCELGELEVIKLRYFENTRFDNIAIKLGYKNHSSVIRKTISIIKKISLINNEHT